MPSICFYFEVHQPFRLHRFNFLDIGSGRSYSDVPQDRAVMEKVAEKCYRPMNALLLELIQAHGGKFKFTFSLTGTVIDQFSMYAPDVLESFQALARTGCVEFLDETDSHSISALFSEEEFRDQVSRHRRRMEELFGQSPRAFRNTELIYSDAVARMVENLGYETMLTEGADHILRGRSPRHVYAPADCQKLKLLLKSYSLSDDIAFRFSNRSWPAWPLNADTYAGWLSRLQGNGDVIGLFMDYETFGEHQWADTGIFEFMRALPGKVLALPDFDFLTVSEAAARYPVREVINVPTPISWADAERDLSAWMGNDMQKDALEALYACRPLVQELDDPDTSRTWRRLQTSDHFYYMSTKCASDGDVHQYFTPYGTPYDAYTNFMNVIADFRLRLQYTLRQRAGSAQNDALPHVSLTEPL